MTSDSSKAVLQRAFDASLRAADPDLAVRRHCRRHLDRLDLPNGDQIELGGGGVWLVGAGKASPRMAAAAVDILGGYLRAGSIVTTDGHGLPLPIDLWEAAHPLPDVRGMAAASEARHLVRSCPPDALVLCLLSGGASALWTAPTSGITLSDLRQVTNALLRAGATIDELNTVRKHLSRIAGGRLATASRAGRMVTLTISDVLGDRPEVIGSGPTAPDPTRYGDALAVLRNFRIVPPSSILTHLRRGVDGEIEETPGPDHPVWQRTSYAVVASLADALSGAAEYLSASGYRTTIIPDYVVGEAREAGAAIARHMLRIASDHPTSGVACIWGGEPTVTVRGSGTGGRCQEMAVAAAAVLDGSHGIAIAFLGTDGTDGPTDAAGAIVDGGSLARAVPHGLDPFDALRRNDTYPFLHASRDLLVTGPTGTNVNDVVIGLVEAG